MNTAVIVGRFDDGMDIAKWANSLIGDYLPEDCGLEGVIVNSIVSIQVVAASSGCWLVVLMVEVWCPGTDDDDPA